MNAGQADFGAAPVIELRLLADPENSQGEQAHEVDEQVGRNAEEGDSTFGGGYAREQKRNGNAARWTGLCHRRHRDMQKRKGGCRTASKRKTDCAVSKRLLRCPRTQSCGGSVHGIL